jgi:hypothetical protein
LLILKEHGININSDFFELSASQVDKIDEIAAAQKYRAPVGKGKSRARAFFDSIYKQMHKRNPVGEPNQQTKIEQAIRLFERFRLDEPKFVDELPAPAVDVAMTIGFLDAVEYTTKRAGKVELYRHEFAKKSRPLLVASWDGAQLLILGGKYDFTKDGIIDK